MFGDDVVSREVNKIAKNMHRESARMNMMLTGKAIPLTSNANSPQKVVALRNVGNTNQIRKIKFQIRKIGK